MPICQRHRLRHNATRNCKCTGELHDPLHQPIELPAGSCEALVDSFQENLAALSFFPPNQVNCKRHIEITHQIMHHKISRSGDGREPVVWILTDESAHKCADPFLCLRRICRSHRGKIAPPDHVSWKIPECHSFQSFLKSITSSWDTDQFR